MPYECIIPGNKCIHRALYISDVLIGSVCIFHLVPCVCVCVREMWCHTLISKALILWHVIFMLCWSDVWIWPKHTHELPNQFLSTPLGALFSSRYTLHPLLPLQFLSLLPLLPVQLLSPITALSHKHMQAFHPNWVNIDLFMQDGRWVVS